jgi:hypothetical protein
MRTGSLKFFCLFIRHQKSTYIVLKIENIKNELEVPFRFLYVYIFFFIKNLNRLFG